MATISEQLDSMRRLSQNWDGYAAAAPRADLVDLAQEFVALFATAGRNSSTSPTMHVSPTRVGGVLLEWEDHLREHEVEFNPDGAIGFLHVVKAR